MQIYQSVKRKWAELWVYATQNTDSVNDTLKLRLMKLNFEWKDKAFLTHFRQNLLKRDDDSLHALQFTLELDAIEYLSPIQIDYGNIRYH